MIHCWTMYYLLQQHCSVMTAVLQWCWSWPQHCLTETGELWPVSEDLCSPVYTTHSLHQCSRGYDQHCFIATLCDLVWTVIRCCQCFHWLQMTEDEQRSPQSLVLNTDPDSEIINNSGWYTVIWIQNHTRDKISQITFSGMGGTPFPHIFQNLIHKGWINFRHCSGLNCFCNVPPNSDENNKITCHENNENHSDSRNHQYFKQSLLVRVWRKLSLSYELF